jgi:hypothetical protein
MTCFCIYIIELSLSSIFNFSTITLADNILGIPLTLKSNNSSTIVYKACLEVKVNSFPK